MRLVQRLGMPDGFVSDASDVAGSKLCWIERPGVNDGTVPLLLVPGLGMTFRAYSWLVPMLSPERRVLIVDPPGCGDSAELADSMSADAQARHLLKWLRSTGIERADVVGHSMGAMTAARFAAAAPDVVGKLVLLSPSPDGRWPELKQHMWALARGVFREAPRTLVQATRDYVTADPSVMTGFSDELGRSAQAVLAGVQASVTVARGKNDRVVSEQWCRALADAAGASMRTVPRAGHGLPQQCPREVAALIRDA